MRRIQPGWTRRTFMLSLPAAASLRAASPANWPSFRGDGSRGVPGDDPRLPGTWSATRNVVWKAEIPGTGWSSPVVWGDRVFLTTALAEGELEPPKKGLYFGGNRLEPPPHPHRWLVYCLDFASGEVRWEREAHRGAPRTPRHLKNSYASETPVTDGERIYAHFGRIGTFCYGFGGGLLWSKQWPVREMKDGWGTASSPALHEGVLYIVDDTEEESYLTALEARTGKEIWRVERDEPSTWSTPYIWQNNLRTEIVAAGRNKVRSYDLDGRLLWELGGMSSLVIPAPFAAGGLLYVTSGYVGDETRPVFAIRPGASGDISAGEARSEALAWFLPQGGPYNPSPLVADGLYYTLFDRGFFTCHDAKTGIEIYGKQRIDREAGAFTASPWAYNGQIFCLSEDGDTFVIQAGPDYKLLGKNSIGEMCMATPAIAQGSLLLRSDRCLYRITSAA